MQEQDSKKQKLKTLEYEAATSPEDQPVGFWSGGREFIEEFIGHLILFTVGIPLVILILIYGEGLVANSRSCIQDSDPRSEIGN